MRRATSTVQTLLALRRAPTASRWQQQLHRRQWLHSARPLLAIKPFLLADIGEGIRECEVIQWFVEPGARVEQFDKLCEVQSDKASVEITSRYDGVIKKLHYEAGNMAIVGKPLVDIDLEDDEVSSTPDTPPVPETPTTTASPPFQNTASHSTAYTPLSPEASEAADPPSKFQSLATPAVRRLTRELNVDLLDVPGTGKDGRVLKEDVLRFAQERDAAPPPQAVNRGPAASSAPTATSAPASLGEEQTVPLTPVQAQMYKTMTGSLSIPHFLYSDEIRLDALNRTRAHINSSSSSLSAGGETPKLTYLPFVIKALSLVLNSYPLLNSRVVAPSSPAEKPQLVTRPAHNIGVAMDTPSGLLVPNIKRVQTLSILEIALELNRLQAAGAAGKLAPADLTGGTITVSNIGNIGGTVCAPVIVPTEVAILGIGRARTVPAFDEHGEIEKRCVVNFSWSADHRVVDGATMARAASAVKGLVEGPEGLLVRLR